MSVKMYNFFNVLLRNYSSIWKIFKNFAVNCLDYTINIFIYLFYYISMYVVIFHACISPFQFFIISTLMADIKSVSLKILTHASVIRVVFI